MSQNQDKTVAFCLRFCGFESPDVKFFGFKTRAEMALKSAAPAKKLSSKIYPLRTLSKTSSDFVMFCFGYNLSNLISYTTSKPLKKLQWRQMKWLGWPLNMIPSSSLVIISKWKLLRNYGFIVFCIFFYLNKSWTSSILQPFQRHFAGWKDEQII